MSEEVLWLVALLSAALLFASRFFPKDKATPPPHEPPVTPPPDKVRAIEDKHVEEVKIVEQGYEKAVEQIENNSRDRAKLVTDDAALDDWLKKVGNKARGE